MRFYPLSIMSIFNYKNSIFKNHIHLIMKKIPVLVLGIILAFFSCKENPSHSTSKESVQGDKLDITALPKASPQQMEALVAQFIEAKEGSTIDIAEGYYEMTTQLILDKVNNVTIKGKGMYKTVLSFKNIKTGGEGMKIAGNNAVLQDFTVMDAPGDCIKTQHCEGITFRSVNTTWTNQDLSKSGTYGIYPVQCKNVVIEKCEVSHSRDAGIYVGQSENIVVRDNYVHENVAGIEIENSDNAEVFNNRAENNTGGILVFNLPGLQKAAGSRTKVYNNTIKENNHVNFAVAIEGSSNGNAVTMVPPGSGVIILAGNEVEVYNNKILNHNTAAVMVASYHFTQLPIPNHPGWTPYTTNIYIHDNTIEKLATNKPDTTKDFSRLIAATCKETQDIVYDGVFDISKMKANPKNPMNFCVREQTPNLKFTRYIMPADGNMANIKLLNDVESFNTYNGSIKTDVAQLIK